MKKFLGFSFAGMMLVGASSLHAASDIPVVPSDSECEALFNFDVVEMVVKHRRFFYGGNISRTEFEHYQKAGTKQRSMERQWISEGKLTKKSDLEPAKKTKLSAQFDVDDESNTSEKEFVGRHGVIQETFHAESDLSPWVDVPSNAQLKVVANNNVPDWPEADDDGWRVIFDPAGLANRVESRVPNKLDLPAESGESSVQSNANDKASGEDQDADDAPIRAVAEDRDEISLLLKEVGLLKEELMSRAPRLPLKKIRKLADALEKAARTRLAQDHPEEAVIPNKPVVLEELEIILEELDKYFFERSHSSRSRFSVDPAKTALLLKRVVSVALALRQVVDTIEEAQKYPDQATSWYAGFGATISAERLAQAKNGLLALVVIAGGSLAVVSGGCYFDWWDLCAGFTWANWLSFF
ncbi:hypothetical protein IPF37_01270 [bacterium]|nr:MAG: hypothetical protein IPF37_01270 [bacterium]